MDNQSAKEIVISMITLINDEQFDEARGYADDGMTFKGVLGARDNADAYFKDMKQMKLKYKIRKAICEGDDVCVFYDLDMGGVNIFGCGWYRVQQAKVISLEVIFDPRPVLAQAPGK